MSGEAAPEPRLKDGSDANQTPENECDREQKIGARFLLSAFFPECAGDEEKCQRNPEAQRRVSPTAVKRDGPNCQSRSDGKNRAEVD